jgi:hypothetical protein
MRRTLLSSFILLLLATAAYADDAMSFSVSGEPSGSMTAVRLRLGPGVTKAVRVYGHPSGRLLAAYANSDGAVSQSAWFKEQFKDRQKGRPFPLASFPFAEGRQIVVQGEGAAANDTGLRIMVYGRWPTPGAQNGVQERDGEFIVATSPRKFGFTITQRLLTEICCGDRDEDGKACDGWDCEECGTTQTLSCCYEESPPHCNYCGQVTAGCNSVCPMCPTG